MTLSAREPKPRLLVLTSTYPRWRDDSEPGFVHELSRRLCGDFEVHVLGPHAPGANATEQLDGVHVMRFRYAPACLETLVNDGGIVANLKRRPWKWLLVPAFLMAGCWATWRAIQALKPNVIHAHWLIPQGLTVALLSLLSWRFPPFVVTSHGVDLFSLRGCAAMAMKRFVVRRASRLTVVSMAMKDEMLKLGVDPTRVQVLSMGVDMRIRFTPDDNVPRAADEILFVGRLVEKKGLRYLIDAMPAILAASPSVTLRVIGFGPERPLLEAQVARLGIERQVRFVGAVPQHELPALYRRAAVFVAPFVQTASGDQEGLGLVTVEAIACGCPVVCSDLPATRDVVGVEGVPPADPATLAAAIVHLLAMSEAARRARSESMRLRLLDRFDWTNVADAYRLLLLAEANSAH